MSEDSIFIPNVKAEDLSKDFIRKVSNRDPETIAKIEAKIERDRLLMSWIWKYGKPKTFIKKIYPWD